MRISNILFCQSCLIYSPIFLESIAKKNPLVFRFVCKVKRVSIKFVAFFRRAAQSNERNHLKVSSQKKEQLLYTCFLFFLFGQRFCCPHHRPTTAHYSDICLSFNTNAVKVLFLLFFSSPLLLLAILGDI